MDSSIADSISATSAWLWMTIPVSFLLGCYVTSWFNQLVKCYAFDKTHPRDRSFRNGPSILFAVRIIMQGATLKTLFRLLSDRIRGRLYVSHKKWLLWGDQHMYAGHPAIAAHVFGPRHAKKWTRLNKDETLSALYKQPGFHRQQRNRGILYMGDSGEWRHLRRDLHPYFGTTDFTTLETRLRNIGRKHLDRVLDENSGLTEVLQQTLSITADMLCQVLYGCELPRGELDTLVTALVEYTVSNGNCQTYGADDLDANAYHKQVANGMALDAPKGTLAWILRNECGTLEESLLYENIGFFMEALTPAFASFWAIAHITAKGLQRNCLESSGFRNQCVKEAMRMYPPVPALWPRMALCDHEMKNPLYDPDPRTRPKQSYWSKLIQGEHISQQPTIKIRKGTKVFLLPSVMHYDDRFWKEPTEFVPERWNGRPEILGRRTDSSNTKKSSIGGSSIPSLDLKRAREAMTVELERSKSSTAPNKNSNRSLPEAIRKELSPFNSGSAQDASLIYHGVRSKYFRTLVFGNEHEVRSMKNSMEDILERSNENAELFQGWSYLPFGGGSHVCLGRRLAVCMVDAIVSTFLEYDVKFVADTTPSLLAKPWYDRITAFTAVYNYPADPVCVHLSGRPINLPGDVQADSATQKLPPQLVSPRAGPTKRRLSV